MKKITAFLLKHEYLIWILCLCAILRLPSLLEPYWYGDEGIYLTLGTGIRHGLTLYKDIHDNKPPLIYMMAAITGSVFWFRFLLLAWNSISIIAFERLSRILFGETDADGTTKIAGVTFPIPRWSTLATLLFALLPFFAEGAIANGEIFMIGPAIVGMYLLWRKAKISDFRLQTSELVLSGVMFSIAFLIKVPSLFDAFAAGFFFLILIPVSLWRERKRQFSLSPHLLSLVTFSIAFLLPIVISFGYYSAKGVGKQYVAAAFAQNIGYLSSWATGTHQATSAGASGLKYRAVGFGIALIILALLAQKNGKKMTFLAIWFAAALFGALLAERPYPHYLIQVIPPGALLLVFFIRRVKEKLDSRSKNKSYLILDTCFFPIQFLTIVIAVALFGYSLFAIKFWYYPLLPYYRNYISFVTGQKNKDAYFASFDPRLPSMYAVSEKIAASTTSDDRIFVWGDYPMIYALARRLPPGRYTSSYHIKDFGGFAETTAAIEKVSPKYIIVDTRYTSVYPDLAGILSDEYIHAGRFDDFVIYRFSGKRSL